MSEADHFGDPVLTQERLVVLSVVTLIHQFNEDIRVAFVQNPLGRFAHGTPYGVVAFSKVASSAVVVDAKDDRARSFYERYGFRAFPDYPRRLFLPMKTIRRLFA